MKLQRITIFLLGAILFVGAGLAIYGYRSQVEIIVNKEDDELLDSKKFHVVGSIYGPKEKPFLRPLTVTSFKDKIFVGDSGNGRVVVYSTGGRFLGAFGDTGDSRTKLLLPTDMAVDNQGSVWVADRQSGRVMVYDQEGNFEKAIPIGEDRTKLQGFSPLSLTFDQQQRLIVFDVNQQRLLLFDSKGRFVKEIYKDKKGLVSYVNGVVSTKDRLFLANSNLGQLLGLEGNQAEELEGLPDPKGFIPRGIFVSRSETEMLITDMYGHRVLQYNLKTGRVTETLGKGNSQNKRFFSYPNDVIVDEGNRLIVADKGNNRIVIIEPVD